MAVARLMACWLILLGAAASPALAQVYPSKPVRVINPYAPGGPVDQIVRPILQQLTVVFDQQFIMDNRGGANGNIGAQEAARAAPDGYTLLAGTTSLLTINPALYKMPFDSIKDFAPIVLVSQIPGAIIVSSTHPAATLKDLLDYARANPGKLSYSSAGNGSQNHLAGELLALLTKTQFLHVPYKGGGPALAAVLAGEVNMIIQSPSLSMAQVRAGKLKVLGVSAPRRMAILPDAPTNDELGLPEFKTRAGTGFLAPAKTPRAIITRLHAEMVKYLNSPEGQKQYTSLGIDLVHGTPEDFSRVLQDELARWAAVVKAANIRIE